MCMPEKFQFPAIDVLEDGWIKNLLGCSVAGLLLIHTQNLGGFTVDSREIMGNENDAKFPFRLSLVEEGVESRPRPQYRLRRSVRQRQGRPDSWPGPMR